MTEDPSPAGISLPYGEMRMCSCPFCGDDDIDEFSLADSIEISEGDDESTAVIEFEGRKLFLSIDDRGMLAWQ